MPTGGEVAQHRPVVSDPTAATRRAATRTLKSIEWLEDLLAIFGGMPGRFQRHAQRTSPSHVPMAYDASPDPPSRNTPIRVQFALGDVTSWGLTYTGRLSCHEQRHRVSCFAIRILFLSSLLSFTTKSAVQWRSVLIEIERPGMRFFGSSNKNRINAHFRNGLEQIDRGRTTWTPRAVLLTCMEDARRQRTFMASAALDWAVIESVRPGVPWLPVARLAYESVIWHVDAISSGASTPRMARSAGMSRHSPHQSVGDVQGWACNLKRSASGTGG